VGSFSIFDRALPRLNPNQGRFRQIADIIYRPRVMFLLGIAVTCMTLSVSVSLGLLVPISAKGYVRRENIIPYVMGANVSTFIDTLFVALMVGEPGAMGIVLAQMISVSVISLVVLGFFYRRYRRLLEGALEAATRSRRAFFVFLGVTMAVPLLFLLL
jgi:Na+/phosphate symporter